MDLDLEISDEDYVIGRAREALKTSIYEAKAWMITAKTLYPTNFTVQFEAYLIEKSVGNVKEAAKCFSEIIGKFQEKEELWKEIEALTTALRAESEDTNSETLFLCEMFKHMSSDVQHHLLLLTANHCEDTMEHCKLILLLLQKFPIAISSYGSKLVDTLISAEKHCHNGSYPSNPYRKLLICDVLPLLANEQNVKLDLSSKVLYKILYKAIEFYLHSLGFMQNIEQEDIKIEGAWQKLFSIVEFIGRQLEWDPLIAFGTNWSKEGYWQKVLTFCQQKPSNIDEKQMVYCLFIFFSYCLDEYIISTTPESSPGQIPTSYVLVEGFLDPTLPVPSIETKFKRRKNDTELFPHISVEKPEMKHIVNNFFMLVNCWEFLSNSEALNREFMKICNLLKIEPYLNGFIADYMVYKGRFDELLSFFQKSNFEIISKSIRIAHIFYVKKNYSACFEQILLILPLLSTKNTGNISTTLIVGGSHRHLHFLPLTHLAVLQYGVKLLLRCITENLLDNNYHEFAIGHALVLTQLDWPQEDEFIPPLMEKIKLQGSFHYPLFQNYIINVDILEELTYLWTTQGGQITLEIIPHLGQRRIGTRGADKGAKEEIKQAIRRQVARSNEKLDDMLFKFLTHERSQILQALV
ncbi:integrator complex subunit 10 [Coccinella septempunctata]|uniref:integrator complex subunit 10 n=1 Tax=Coccinella septempunctata TaxID=41139 RepID=UPI001D067D16|nr:integrator complex subunit 10 [Coccinella septempunctata]